MPSSNCKANTNATHLCLMLVYFLILLPTSVHVLISLLWYSVQPDIFYFWVSIRQSFFFLYIWDVNFNTCTQFITTRWQKNNYTIIGVDTLTGRQRETDVKTEWVCSISDIDSEEWMTEEAKRQPLLQTDRPTTTQIDRQTGNQVNKSLIEYPEKKIPPSITFKNKETINPNINYSLLITRKFKTNKYSHTHKRRPVHFAGLLT